MGVQMFPWVLRLLLNTGDGGSNGGGGTGGGTGDGGGTGGGGGTPFYAGFKDADLKGYVESKGFKDPELLASSYRELEKLRGAPADRILSLPADDKPESWAPVFDKLGRPKDKVYELPIAEGAPEGFAAAMAEQFHAAGLSKKQGQAVAGWWSKLAEDAKTAEETELQLAQGEQKKNLQKEWGGAFEKNLQLAGEFAEKIGIDDETAAKLRSTLGVDGFGKLMVGIVQKFGIKLGESEFDRGAGGNTFDVMTPAAAKAKREELLSDNDFKQKYLGGSKKEVNIITKLYEQEFAPST